jgi:plasmid stabilization system protein ParE
MKVHVPASVLAELEEIEAYIAVDNPAAARALMLRLEKLFERLTIFPYLANEVEPGVRALSARPYLIFYEIRNDEITILRVRHAARLRP